MRRVDKPLIVVGLQALWEGSDQMAAHTGQQDMDGVVSTLGG